MSLYSMLTLIFQELSLHFPSLFPFPRFHFSMIFGFWLFISIDLYFITSWNIIDNIKIAESLTLSLSLLLGLVFHILQVIFHSSVSFFEGSLRNGFEYLWLYQSMFLGVEWFFMNVYDSVFFFFLRFGFFLINKTFIKKTREFNSVSCGSFFFSLYKK